MVEKNLMKAVIAFLFAVKISEAAVQGQQPVRFDPEHQIPVALVTPELRAEVRVFPESLSGQTRGVRITTPTGVSEVPLPFQFYQVNGILIGPPGELVVVGMSAGTVYDIGIIDLAAHKVADHFWCYSPAVSPDGRYVAFTKFFGPHSTLSPDDHNMLYIVGRSAEDNRPPGISPDDLEDVGFAIYPSGVGNQIGDNANVPSEMANVVAGQYFWKGARQYLFADTTQGEFSVVWVTVDKHVANVRRLVIAPPRTRVQTGGHFPFRLGDVSVEGDEISLTLLSNVSQLMVVRLTDFASSYIIDLASRPKGRP